MRYLKVPYFKQDNRYTCGPTVLQMVFAYYGVRLSEADLAHELHTNTDIGTRHSALSTVARKFNMYCYVKDQATVTDIEHIVSLRIPPIIHYVEPECEEDHYAVVVGVADGTVMLNDPWRGERFPMEHREFNKRWTCGTLGDCRHWLLAISPEPIPVERQLHPLKAVV